MRDLLLPVIVNGRPQGEEVVPAEPIGPGRFRVCGSPGVVEGLAAGDEIELTHDLPQGFRVLRRGGNLCVWFVFSHPVEEQSPETTAVRRLVEAVGGWLDGGRGRALVLTIPVAAGFPAVERALSAAAARYPGSAWLYGNVYDPADGETPLDWWR